MRIAWGKSDVRDRLIFCGTRFDRQIEASANAFVGTNIAEGLAAGKDGALQHLDAVDVCRRGPRARKQTNQNHKW